MPIYTPHFNSINDIFRYDCTYFFYHYITILKLILKPKRKLGTMKDISVTLKFVWEAKRLQNNMKHLYSNLTYKNFFYTKFMKHLF